MYLFIFPLKIERKHFCDYFQKKGISISREQYDRGHVLRISNRDWICAVGGLGKVQMGIQTQYWLSQLPQIRGVFCVGTGGGLVKGSLQSGDIVLGSSVIEYDFKARIYPLVGNKNVGKKHVVKNVVKNVEKNVEKNEEKNVEKNDVEKNEIRGVKKPVFFSSVPLLESVRSCALVHSGFSIITGVIASGDEDIVTEEQAHRLHRDTGAICVAWEGAGLARACRFYKIPFLEIRGLTDFCVSSERSSLADEFEKNLPLAIQNIASLFWDWKASLNKGDPNENEDET